MHLEPIKTKVVHAHDDLFQIIAESVTKIPEKSVLVVTSKIVGLCEGRVVDIKPNDRAYKQQLAKQEADYYLDESHSKYDLVITIKDQIVAVNAGLDESNAGGQYVLFPQKPYQSAQRIWEFLRQHYGVKEVGVLITDSRTIPLKWGVIGTHLAHCGFRALNNKIGQPDLFGHTMEMTQVGVAEALAVAAVLEMGEVAEAQPLCLITQAHMVEFMDQPLTQSEIDQLVIDPADDVYAPLVQAAPWQKNK